jgi:hypothetical protein
MVVASLIVTRKKKYKKGKRYWFGWYVRSDLILFFLCVLERKKKAKQHADYIPPMLQFCV